MRIERVMVDGFGRLAGVDTGPVSLPGLVVVLGPNEAGKSTLFHFLTTALYGFLPATREKNPYVPWGADEAGGTIEVRLDGGGCAEVVRRLRSQPAGKLRVDGGIEELRNRALPWVSHVPRTVFRQVFAVRLADLAGLDQETWARVQDRILGSMGASDLRSAREAADELEREAGELWRPNRRGNQVVRDAQERIGELREERKRAAERDRTMRSLVQERDDARTRLDVLREERSRSSVELEALQTLLPARRRLRRIASLRQEAGPPEALSGLPSDPPARLAELADRAHQLRARCEQIDAEMSDPRQAASALGPVETALLDRKDEVASFLGRAASLAPARTRHETLGQEILDLDRRIADAARDLLDGGWRPALAPRIASLATDELKRLVDRVEAGRRERAIRDAAAGRIPGGPGGGGAVPPWLAPFIGLLAGGLLAAIGLTEARVPVAVAGGMTSLIALGLLVRALLPGRPTPHGSGQTSDESAARDALRSLLRDVPVSTALLDEPGDDLARGLQELQHHVRDRDQRAQARTDLEASLAQLDQDAAALALTLGMERTDDGAVTASALDRELRRAERLAEAATVAAREVQRLEREAERTRRERSSVDAELTRLQERLAPFGEGDVERAAAAAAARLRALRRAEELSDELERERPDLDELEARVAGTAPDDGELARRRADIERLTDEIEALAAGAERLDAEVQRLRELDTVDAVDGRIAHLEKEIADLMRQRDRRWILAQLLREADRRFREEHQPDLMRRASAFLEHLTGGRYRRIVAEEAGGGDAFHVVGRALPTPIPLAEPVSTGTLEQAYLALRLAIVDHLDQGGERLPLFIDEVFVNWDPERRARGLDVLGSLSHSRQLFVFTCHPDVADELEERGGRVLTLESG